MSLIAAIVQAAAVILCVMGAFFFLVGTVGILRLPDFFSRTHAATKCDTVGAGSILLGLTLLEGFRPDALRLIALAGLVLVSSPTAGHALARAAYRTGLKPWTLAAKDKGGDAA
ncbi:MAG: monovalent cation/H(+) antiporter subunit G [Coriobacteriia bacterium]|nr:monovalent cation/H(+) antiporter subunit G [Coriobacteriia bacterium]